MMESNSQTHKNQEPGFYAIIPATVRYDKSLPMGARLLYAEITSRTHQTGYCWTRDARFASLFDTEERTIRRWIEALKIKEYIQVSYVYFPDSRKIQERRITLRDASPLGKQKNPAAQPMESSETKNLHISADKNVRTKPPNSCLVRTKMSGPGGDKNVRENIKELNIIAAATPPPEPPPPKPQTETAAAAPNPDEPKTQDIVRLALAAKDPSLVFSQPFYNHTATFAAGSGLSPPDLNRYCAFVIDQAKLKKPISLRGMIARLFFEPDILEIFKAKSKPPPPQAPPIQITCPACGASHPEHEHCPVCFLAPHPSENDIAFHSALMRLPTKQRDAYWKRLEEMFSSPMEFSKKLEALRKLKKEFGLPYD